MKLRHLSIKNIVDGNTIAIWYQTNDDRSDPLIVAIHQFIGRSTLALHRYIMYDDEIRQMDLIVDKPSSRIAIE